MIVPSNLFHRKAIMADSVDFLIGRSSLISEIANKLAEDDVSCVIYGMRGVGKTTIAWQVLSVLSGKNPKFKKNDVLVFNKNAKFIVCLHKCSSQIKTIGDLLLELVIDGSNEYSFPKRFSKIYKDAKITSKIQRKFGINILKIVQYSETEEKEIRNITERAKDLMTNEQSKIRLFKEIIEQAKNKYPAHRLIIAFDEMDRPGEKGDYEDPSTIRGLGNFIKDIDDVQFIFIGIGQTIENIISDHRSAPRKLAGNDFEAPLLDDNEIRQIFEAAQRLSNGELTISDHFIEKAIEYSGGIPWIAQHTGYEATFKKAMKGPDSNIRLEIEDFDPAIRSVTRIYEKDAEHEVKAGVLGEAGVTGEEILKIIWRNPNGIAEERIRAALSKKYKKYFDRAIRKLESGNIIRRRGQFLIFPDPALRILVKYHLDK